MNGRKPKLELKWIGKDQRPKLEPRILIEDPEKSCHAARRVTDHDIFDNRLIFGDNLLALKALDQEFAGQVRCIYIDPPYNTGSAFEHYDDGLEHSIWLGMMRDRLELLRRLLRNDGVIFVHIDDNEHAYLKVLMDEVFGRRNFCGQFIWEKKKKPSFLNANMGIVTEYILAYSPDRSSSPAFIGGLTTEGKKYPLNNAGNGLQTLCFPPESVEFRCPDGRYEPQDMSEGAIVTRLLDRLIVKNGKNSNAFRLEGEWRYSQKKLDEIIAAKETLVISKIPFRPNHIKAGGEKKKIKNLLSIAHYQISTYEDSNAESEALFGENAFDYPKPEKLLSTLISAVTSPGDWVLDSFAGSGTTGAVAHKMGRRWIMVELGEHCHTHIIPRLKKVIDGEDEGGITKAVGWKGGGGFRYYTLAPSLLEKDPWGNWVINKEYNAAMLAQAMCKHEGFTYAPSEEVYWQQGHSSERDFIYVTTQTLNRAQLQAISDEVGPSRTLLICCSAFRVKPDAFPNLTLKKIPKAVLNNCEWGRDDYSLEVSALPAAPTPEEDAAKRIEELPLFAREEPE
ncbi:MAG: site-specific DNA-methyltransferase [Verrucomicrobia bacterium]|nr:site-specific DNA-methyltransferase [Verrucomicrobiota bacterium]